jgi:hypothetical protein
MDQTRPPKTRHGYIFERGFLKFGNHSEAIGLEDLGWTALDSFSIFFLPSYSFTAARSNSVYHYDPLIFPFHNAVYVVRPLSMIRETGKMRRSHGIPSQSFISAYVSLCYSTYSSIPFFSCSSTF